MVDLSLAYRSFLGSRMIKEIHILYREQVQSTVCILSCFTVTVVVWFDIILHVWSALPFTFSSPVKLHHKTRNQCKVFLRHKYKLISFLYHISVRYSTFDPYYIIYLYRFIAFSRARI